MRELEIISVMKNARAKPFKIYCVLYNFRTHPLQNLWKNVKITTADSAQSWGGGEPKDKFRSSGLADRKAGERERRREGGRPLEKTMHFA